MTMCAEPGLSERLRKLAAKLQGEINKDRAERLMNTRKRIQEAEYFRARADKTEWVQRALLALADSWDRGDLAPCLTQVRSRADAERLRDWHEYPSDRSPVLQKQFAKIGIGGERAFQEAKAALAALVEKRQVDPEEQRRRAIAASELNIARFEIPGFFQTPAAVADRMVELAELEDGMLVLEPSAGAGRLIDARGRAPQKIYVEAIERQHSLAEHLYLKGCPVVGDDFMTFELAHEQYDRVLMNPPFEKLADIDHVLRAIAFTKPGGLVVAITSPGPWFREDKKAVAFRQQVEGMVQEQIDLPSGTFADTGVASKLTVFRVPA